MAEFLADHTAYEQLRGCGPGAVAAHTAAAENPYTKENYYR